MKITWKIFFSTVLAMTVTFCIAGYFLISAFFESGYEQAVNGAIDVSRMFLRAFGNYMVTVNGSDGDMAKNIDALADDLLEESIHIRITGGDGTVLFSDVPFGENFPGQNAGSNQEITYILVREQEDYYLQINSSILVEKTDYYLSTYHRVTELFEERREQMNIYNRFLLWFMMINGLISWILARVIVKPIGKISHIAAKIADGDLESRIAIRNYDEIGNMAVNFNRMADRIAGKILELEDAARRQEEFIGSFAHELKTPLTSIIGYADLLRSKRQTEEQQFLCANYIFEEAKRLETLSLRLLDLIVMENKELRLRKVEVPVLFDEIAGVMASVLEGQGIRLTFEAQEGILWIEPELIRSVIINLIDNARKSGCTSIILNGSQEENFYFIDVCDNGRGIPKDELAHITEAFYMVDKSRSQEQGGAGLGLAICRKIMELHGAQMIFESECGNGTKVRLKFTEQKQIL